MEVRKALTDFIARSGKSQAQVAKEIGVSSAVISQYLSASYKGDMEKTESQIQAYLQIAEQRLKNAAIAVYNPNTENAQQILMAVSYAHRFSKMAMVYGDAGAGKTETLKRYAAKDASVVMVTANASCKTSRAVLHMIATALGLHPTGTESAIMDLLIDRLSGTNRLIIIDEADHLTLNALQAVRNLFDVANIGVVLSGNEMTIYQMYVKRNSQATKFDQLRSRIGMKIKVSNQIFTYEEMALIFPALASDCINELLKITRSYSLRTAINVCEYASLLAASQNQPITGKIINLAFESAFRLS